MAWPRDPPQSPAPSGRRGTVLFLAGFLALGAWFAIGESTLLSSVSQEVVWHQAETVHLQKDADSTSYSRPASIADEIKKLYDLKTAGAIDEAEYRTLKDHIIAQSRKVVPVPSRDTGLSNRGDDKKSVPQPSSFKYAVTHGEWRRSGSRYNAEGRWFWDALETPQWEQHFDKARFCERLPDGDLLLVGDSITSQSIMALFDLYKNATKEFGTTWRQGWGDNAKEGLVFSICQTGESHGKIVRHVRNDHLHLDVHTSFDEAASCPFYCWDWVKWLPRAGLVVMNTGAHFHQIGNIQAYETRLRLVRDMVDQYPDTRFLFRGTLPGHTGCVGYDGGALSSEEVEASRWKVSETNSYHWQDFKNLNNIARRVFGDDLMLDFYEPYRRRPDNHQSKEAIAGDWPTEEHREDCLHWSGGGASPLRYWPVFLQNRLALDP